MSLLLQNEMQITTRNKYVAYGVISRSHRAGQGADFRQRRQPSARALRAFPRPLACRGAVLLTSRTNASLRFSDERGSLDTTAYLHPHFFYSITTFRCLNLPVSVVVPFISFPFIRRSTWAPWPQSVRGLADQTLTGQFDTVLCPAIC